MISFSKPTWYDDVTYYLVCGLMPEELSSHQRKRFLFDVKIYLWYEPYYFANVVTTSLDNVFLRNKYWIYSTLVMLHL